MEGFLNHIIITFELTVNAEMSKSLYYSCDYDSLLAEIAVQFFWAYCYSNVNVNVNLWYN